MMWRFYLSPPIIANVIDCNADNIILKNKAIQNESTLNPSTILAHNKTIKVLITSKKSPKVMKVKGNVSITKIGLTIKLRSAKTIATIKALVKPAT